MNSPNFEDYYNEIKSLSKKDLVKIIRDKNDLLVDYANEVTNLKTKLKKLEG
tara:strand:+ start:304 stop:459 length:156 start_codon:yes stop_codon:yes gene_type:complete